MKKKYLFVIFLCSFLLAVLQVRRLSSAKPDVSISLKHNKSFAANNGYSNTAFEVRDVSNIFSSGCNYRVQNGFGCLPLFNVGITSQLLFSTGSISMQGIGSFKEYLLHIYPSHNFW